MRRRLTLIAGLLTLGLLTLASTGCGVGQGSGQQSESNTQQSNYDRLVHQEPAHTMSVSPTRKTINFWIDTWGHDPDKLSYVYMQGANGNLLGYYIFKGLPVNYCVSLTPNYKFVDPPGDGSDTLYQVPAPSIDGVYYSGGGCQTFYGRDATTDQYIEYTVGAGINVLIYERPLPRQNVEPLGFTTVEEAKSATRK